MTTSSLDTLERLVARSFVYEELGEADVNRELYALGEGLQEALATVCEFAEIDFESSQESRVGAGQIAQSALEQNVDLAICLANHADTRQDLQDDVGKLVTVGRVAYTFILSRLVVEGVADWLFRYFKTPYPLQDGVHEQMVVANFIESQSVSVFHQEQEALLDLVIALTQNVINNRERLQHLGIRF